MTKNRDIGNRSMRYCIFKRMWAWSVLISGSSSVCARLSVNCAQFTQVRQIEYLLNQIDQILKCSQGFGIILHQIDIKSPKEMIKIWFVGQVDLLPINSEECSLIIAWALILLMSSKLMQVLCSSVLKVPSIKFTEKYEPKISISKRQSFFWPPERKTTASSWEASFTSDSSRIFLCGRTIRRNWG